MSVSTVKATINGQIYNLTLNDSTGKYEATITAPSTSSYNNNDGHYYPVSITATDDGGNNTTIDDTHETLGESLKLRVKEKVAPTITITAPTAGATITNNKPAITAQLRDDDSGVNTDSIILKIDTTTVEVSAIAKNPVSGGYDISYTPTEALSDGNHNISIQVSDNDGNQCNAVTSTIKVDTVPPTLTVTTPTDGLITNTATLTISGTTNDVTSSPVTVTITLNTVDQGAVTVESSGAFNKELTLAEGSNTIVITATDSAGKASSVTRTVTLDTGAPIFHSVSIAPNPVDAGATYVITVEVTD